MPVISKGGAEGAAASRRHRAGDEDRRRSGSRARARSPASSTACEPEPPLFPADPERRAAVEEAERFGDEDLQHPVRQILWWALRKDAAPLRSYSEGARLGVPIGLAVRTAAPIVALSARFNEASDDNVRADLAALPGLLRSDRRLDRRRRARRRASRTPPTSRSPPACGLAMTLRRPAPGDRGPPGRASWRCGSSRLPGRGRRRSCRRPGSSRCAPAPRPAA